MFNMDFSQDKPDIRELIPAGTIVYVEMTYRPGGADLPGTPQDKKEGALTAAKPPSDAFYLSTEYTILRGPYKGRKFWGNLTVFGGKVDEKGNSIAAGISRQTIRAIIDSSQNLSSKDESPDAMAKRVIRGFRDLQRKKFVCKVKIEKGQNGYADKNGLGQVLTLDMKDYPKSAAELDNVVKAAAKEEAPAPAWAASAPTAATAPVAAPAAAAPAWEAPATAAVVGLTTAIVAETAAIVAETAATPAQDDNIPAWARQAA